MRPRRTARTLGERVSVAAVVLSLTACGAETPEAAAPEPTPTPAPSSPASPPPAPTSPFEDPAALVERATELFGVSVTRAGETYQTRSLWGVGCDHFECSPIVLATSDTSGESSYRVGSYDRLQRGIWTPRPPGAPTGGGCATSVGPVTICVTPDRALTRTDDGGRTWEPVDNPSTDRLMWQPLVSLAPGIDGIADGSDGATLFPFEQVVRVSSPQDTTYRVEWPGGVMGYASGTVVLSDGRVLTLLADWSDDGRRPSKRHHGLWASEGDDWASYSAVEPVFSPPLTTAGSGPDALAALAASADPDPVIWVRTWDLRLYVSTDDAATFEELRIR